MLWTKEALDDVTVTVSELKSGSAVIPASAITTNFVRYVMTDELNKDRKVVADIAKTRPNGIRLSLADVLDIVKYRISSLYDTTDLAERMGPSDARAGKYKGTLTVSGKNFQDMKLQVEIDVQNRTLPAPQDWAFHLDLWQNPYSVARYYQVPLGARSISTPCFRS